MISLVECKHRKSTQVTLRNQTLERIRGCGRLHKEFSAVKRHDTYVENLAIPVSELYDSKHRYYVSKALNKHYA